MTEAQTREKHHISVCAQTERYSTSEPEKGFVSKVVRVVIAGDLLYEVPVDEEVSFKKKVAPALVWVVLSSLALVTCV